MECQKTCAQCTQRKITWTHAKYEVTGEQDSASFQYNPPPVRFDGLVIVGSVSGGQNTQDCPNKGVKEIQCEKFDGSRLSEEHPFDMK